MKKLPKQIVMVFIGTIILIAGVGFISRVADLNTPEKIPVDLQLFSSQCNNSCWNGIQVNETTVDSLRLILKQEFGAYQESEASIIWEDRADGVSWNEPQAKMFTLDNKNALSLTIDTFYDLVHRIELYADPFAYSIADMIRDLGETEYVNIMYSTSQVYDDVSWITFFYPTRGYAFKVYPDTKWMADSVQVCVNSEQLINRIYIGASSNSLEEFLINIGSLNNEYYFEKYRAYVLESIKPLSDFGCFDLPFPPDPPLGISGFQTW